MRSLALALLLTACRFDGAGVSGDTSGADAATRLDAGDAPADAARAPICDASDPTLLACYRFEPDDHPLQPFDESSYGNHGTTIASGFDAGPAGRGRALLVNAGSLVTVPDSASLDAPGPLTLEVWVRVDAAPPPGGRAGILDDNGQWGLFLSSALEIRCAMSSTVVIGLSLTLGEWTHVACVYDRQTVQLFQDGAPGPSLNYTAALTTDGTDGVRIGQNSPSGDPFTGALDDLRIWGRALGADELCSAASCAP